ncbi:MAG: cyclic nucleotide-binding domain-containing protein [Bacteroidia bacterium]|nr:cyclic nucleotide-binding domain-containing protein [Bacteroidia bacterium]
MPVILMIGFRIVYLLINLEFWGLSALVFDVRQGKRLFGLISSGDVPAKLLGYASVFTLVPYINLENLLVVGALSFFVSYYFLKQILNSTELQVHHKHDHSSKFSDTNIIKSFFGNNFIMSISFLGFLIIVSFTIIEYVFLSSVQSQYTSEKELASFLSIFFSVGYFITMIFKSMLSGRFSDKVGLKNSLMILPILLLLFSAVFMFYGSSNITLIRNLVFIGIMTMAMGVIKYSINDPVFLVLFQPLPPHLRLKGHSVIKGFVQPLGLGLMGLLLWIINKSFGLSNFYYLNFGLAVVLCLWIVGIYYANKFYLDTLSYAIRKRFISGANIAVKDSKYFDLLLRKVNSNNNQEVSYAISVLSNSNPNLLKNEIPNLIKKDDSIILEYVISAINNHNWSEFTDHLLNVFEKHPSNKVKALAVNSYARLYSGELEQLINNISSQNELTRKAIITGLIASENGPNKRIAKGVLEKLINSERRRDKIEACNIIAYLENQDYTKSLIKFLNSGDDGLVRASIIASGKVKSKLLLPRLFELLNIGRWKNDIIYGLSGFEEIAKEINRINNSHNLNHGAIIDFIKILDRVKDDDSLSCLLTYLQDSNADVRDMALSSVSNWPLKNTIEHAAIFQKLVEDEFQLAFKMINAIEIENLNDELENALNFELATLTKRIFALLGLYHNKEIVRKSERALKLADKESKANALEILDHYIPKNLHQCLIALVDDIEAKEKLHHLKRFQGHGDLYVIEFILLNGSKYFNNFTIACALNHSKNFIDKAPKYLENTNLLIRQCAANSLIAFNKNSPEEAKVLFREFNIETEMLEKENKDNGLSELEKIIVLKSTELFSDTPENVIAEIAAIVEEVIVPKNELVFKKGDPGNSMYIIHNGEIRIHDLEKTFAVLQNLDFFGELALLDPEPRSASATATKDSLLMKINQEAAYELMEDRTEVLKSMMTILCRRIRIQNDKLAMAIDAQNS